MDKSYRIHTNIASDTLLQVNMQQDFDFLEILSLKLKQKDAYRIHSSNYGVIVGRVLANDAFGIPNAKISVFIERDENDPTDMEMIYPYAENTSKDKEGRRYNLLPDYSHDDCYRIVGTFPNKRLMLDDSVQLEVYDKYYKFTTTTNNAGDYMLFGVPANTVQIHVDIDLSDIGILSQKPRDFEYKGYNVTEFDSSSQFKESTNLDGLAQIFSQNKSVFVYPFWGDAENGIACITRSDIQIDYKFEPTCVFMGSIVSDNDGNAIGHKCAPEVNNGLNDQLIGGNGTIEMIRKTVDGLVEEFQIQGNQLIDENGVWCYQIPMNLDFIGTDEYGNVVPTDNPNKGIPTRTQVRFRISKNETGDEGFSRHTAKYLVPMNPIFSEKDTTPKIGDRGSDIEQMYVFGSGTPEHCFRDLYWNNVYSVKNYIPRTQISTRAYSNNYCALKGSNLATDQNSIPFNKLRVDIPFSYIMMCILFTMVMWIISIVNAVFSIIDIPFAAINKARDWTLITILGKKIKPLSILPKMPILKCIPLSAGLSEGNTAYYPGCISKDALEESPCPEDMKTDGCKKENNNSDLIDKVQRNLAQDYKLVKLDFYQDWLNGCLYMPLWYWRKRKKKKFLFFTLSGAKNEYCDESKAKYKRHRSLITCNIKYRDTSFQTQNNKESMPDNEEKWHKSRVAIVSYRRGLIKPVENRDGLTAYYYSALAATTENDNPELDMADRGSNFKAIRLFATDIILLGNIDPKNIYGIPQFFTSLPSTTANIPPIATIEESDEDENNEAPTSSFNDAEESGTSLTTGMDWNHNGSKMTPKYSTGLFMDLACTYVNTRSKACVNVERLSEYGVNLDMTYLATYRGGNKVEYGTIQADGFISKLELDDMENRAMFATMNHIGFIPQTYQDMVSGYTTQVPDKNTGYFVPKFKYIYPVDFDGRLKIPMELYKNGSKQPLYDEVDQSYITFRLGAESADKFDSNSEGRVRHFYHYNGGYYYMPLYNNSFYFYFGIKKGSTAIDKFNQLFYSPCYKNSKAPFSLVINTRGRSYCPSTYSGKDGEKNSNKINNAYGWIRVKSDDIRSPYSYTLYYGDGREIISESGMTMDDFVIGGYVESGDVKSNSGACIQYQISKENLMIGDGDDKRCAILENGDYILEMTDSDGNRITEKVKLSRPTIEGSYTATRLGTRYYNSAATRIDYICHDDNSFYGKIDMTGFSVDGYDCKITGATSDGYDGKNGYFFTISGSCEDFISSSVTATLLVTVDTDEEEKQVRNCLCDSTNEFTTINEDGTEEKHITNQIAEMQGASGGTYIQGANVGTHYAGFNDGVFTIYIFQPNTYKLTLMQAPNGENKECESENISTSMVTILNGEPFMTYLNGMPLRFMLGTTNDSSGATVANTSHFYNSSCSTIATDSRLSGWYGLHQEDSYMFDTDSNKTLLKNQEIWEDVLPSMSNEITMPSVKQQILKFKFEKMFALSHGAYLYEDSSKQLTFSATGGVSPILYRSIYPLYGTEDVGSKYNMDDSWQSTCSDSEANIVAPNYVDNKDWAKKQPSERKEYEPQFNNLFTDEKYSGNYFAAFTRDGGYISKKDIDGNIKIERSPSFASVSPINKNKVKEKGKDVTNAITAFELAYTAGTQTIGGKSIKTLPYLRGMYVDRRIDFDMVFLGPAVGNNLSLYNSGDGKERIWKGGRISGYTYNGIEMAYDEDYNIISANHKTEPIDGDEYVTGAEPNTRLEYSYEYGTAHKCMNCGGVFSNYNDGNCPICLEKGEGTIIPFYGEIENEANAVTKYNKGNEDSVWGSWNSIGAGVRTFGYNKDKDPDDLPLIKEFYSALLCNVDIRHLYWSLFNRKRLNTYISGDTECGQIGGSGDKGITNANNPFYVYAYPGNDSSLYNGDFNRYDVANGNVYPTKRFIDIGNLPTLPQYSYELYGCSYDMNVTIEEDESIKSEVDYGETFEMYLDFGKPVTFVNGLNYNVLYNKKSSSGGVLTFEAEKAKMQFRLNPYSVDGFEVYTRTPRLIQVLPYINGIDGIGYYKTANQGSEFEEKFGDGKTLDEAIDDILIRDGEFIDKKKYILPPDVKFKKSYTTKSGVELGSWTSFQKDDEWLTSDDEDFVNIIYYNYAIKLINNKTGSGVTAFAILVDREFQCSKDDHLIKHVRVIETSEVMDCRKINLGLVEYDDSVTEGGEELEVGAYVIVENDADTGSTTGGGDTEEDEGARLIQVITFSINVDNKNTTNQNSALLDYEGLTYNFVFVNRDRKSFQITPSRIVAEENEESTKVKLVCQWSADMGILADSQWSKNKYDIPMQLKITTSSGFVYLLTDFYLKFDRQEFNRETLMNPTVKNGTKAKTTITFKD